MQMSTLYLMYDTNYKHYQEGRISQEIWLEFCEAILEILMTENCDVLLRLKNE